MLLRVTATCNIMDEDEDDVVRIAKDSSELTVGDLLCHAVWEYGIDEYWEVEWNDPISAVRPLGFGDPQYANPEGHLLIGADFLLVDGSEMMGYVTYCPELDNNDMGYAQPTIVTPAGQVQFWSGITKPRESDLRERYSRLGKRADEVFPATFKTVPNEVGIEMSGILDGFLYMEGDAETVAVLK